jgi:AcrR family transcriptional regulator
LPNHSAAVINQKRAAAIKRFEETRHFALSLFAIKGYSNVGMRELASALGIGCGSIYNHIESKEALLYEFFEELFDALYVQALQIRKRVAARQRLRAMVKMHLALQACMPEHFQIVESEWRHLGEDLQAHASARRLRYEELLAESFGLGAAGHGCTASIVTLLNQSPAWLNPIAATGTARLELMLGIIAVMVDASTETAASDCVGANLLRKETPRFI